MTLNNLRKILGERFWLLPEHGQTKGEILVSLLRECEAVSWRDSAGRTHEIPPRKINLS